MPHFTDNRRQGGAETIAILGEPIDPNNRISIEDTEDGAEMTFGTPDELAIEEIDAHYAGFLLMTETKD